MAHRSTPLARQRGLVSRLVGDELLVYDLERQQAHALNAPAAAVWRIADGTRTVPEIAATLRDRTPSIPEPAVRYALAELSRARLLTTPVAAGGLTRRELVRRLGSAAALPLVASIVAPTAARAQSCVRPGSGAVCQASEECCPCPPGLTPVCVDPPDGACSCEAR
jgi:hypothetical protein